MKAILNLSQKQPMIQWLAFGLLMAAISNAAFGNGPESDINVGSGHKFEKSEVLLSGSATDQDGIASVRVAVKDRATKRWLQRDGKWRAKRAWLRADLSIRDGATTPWLFRQSLPVGKYSVRARATNLSGVRQTENLPSRKVRVVKDRSKLKARNRWLTIQFGRSAWGAAGGGTCEPYTESVSLGDIATYLTEYGYTAQGSVPFGHIDTKEPDVRKCPWSGNVSASLNDLARLRDRHGWTFVADSIGPLPSNPSTRPGMTELTCDDQIASASASLAELQRHGHFRGWGLIAPPAGGVSTGIRDNVESRFYSFSRSYGYNYRITENTKAKALDGDWAYFKSVDGGLCNDELAPCYDHYVSGSYPRPFRYLTPDALLEYMVAERGEWRGVQFYRLVSGSRLPPPDEYPGTAEEPAGTGNESYWDCTSGNSDLHWTSRAELYCFEDFADVIDRLSEEHRDVITTDTARIATTWGIGNPNHDTRYPICRCQTDSDCDTGRTCQGGRCRK
jgi:hypothetical protein